MLRRTRPQTERRRFALCQQSMAALRQQNTQTNCRIGGIQQWQTISELQHITRPKISRSLWIQTDCLKNSGNSRPLWYPKASKSSKSEVKINSTKAICRKQSKIPFTLSCVPARAENRKYKAIALRLKVKHTRLYETKNAASLRLFLCFILFPNLRTQILDRPKTQSRSF